VTGPGFLSHSSGNIFFEINESETFFPEASFAWFPTPAFLRSANFRASSMNASSENLASLVIARSSLVASSVIAASSLVE
jgi:hypothetical protein